MTDARAAEPLDVGDMWWRPRPARRPTTESFAEATRLLHSAALDRALDALHPTGLAPLLHGPLAARPLTLDLAIDTAVREEVHDLLTHGWRPSELHAFATNRLDPASVTYLVDALAAAAQWSVSVSWRSELAQLGSEVWWTVGEPHLGQWARRHNQHRDDTVQVAVDVLALLRYLPRTDGSQPGLPGLPDIPFDSLVQDARIIAKIDALLTRAADLGFPDEAAACASKAQELMVRYATVPEPPRGSTAMASAANALRRLCTESPVVTARTLFSGTRAGTGIARTAIVEPRRLVTSFGEEAAGLVSRATLALVPGALRRRPSPRPIEASSRPRPLPASA